MTESTPFELSRIYASGWSAGRKCHIEDGVEIDEAASRQNPHTAFADRDRWNQGFREAVLHQAATPAKFRRASETRQEKGNDR